VNQSEEKSAGPTGEPGETAIWDALAAKSREGDRQALAEFFILIEMRFRRRFRKRLRPGLLHESGDLWATTYLRLDEFLQRGGFVHATSGAQLWSLSLRTADRIIGQWQRRRRIEECARGRGEADPGCETSVGRQQRATNAANFDGAAARKLLAEVLEEIEGPLDRQVVAMRARGQRWQAVAIALGAPVAALRKRIATIRDSFRRRGELRSLKSPA
jgi:hypothetical protein